MADVSVNVGVTGIQQFKSGMSDAQASVKTFDAALKANEKQLKANGNAENYLQAQTSLLNGKLKEQKKIAENAQKALDQMRENGVKQSSKAYQEMQRKLIEAQSAMLDTQMQLENLGKAETDATGKTDKLATSLGGLNKKVSLEQVSSVVDKISGGLEKGAKKAIELGKAIWENITDVARFSDDTATQAMILDMSVEDYQAYKKVFDTTAELTVQEWQKAKQKVQKAINDPTKEQTNLLNLLGINTKSWQQLKGQSGPSLVGKNFEEMFWEIGATLKRKVESGELTQDVADTYANELFGKTFANLKPIFDMGEKEFQKAVDDQLVASEEAIKKNAELNDTLVKLQSDFTSLKVEVLSGLAPALTKGAESLDSLLARIMEWLETPEGKEALKDMETAVSGLFDDLGKIDPEQVVSGFTSVFNTIVGGLEWLVENKETAGNVLKGIVGLWGLTTLTGGALDVLKLVDGLRGLKAGEAAAAGEAAGRAWGSGFAAAVAKAAPWLIGLYTLLNPASGSDALGDNTLIDENGNLTAEAQHYGFVKDKNGEIVQDRTQIINDAAQKAWDLYRSNQLTQAGMEELRSAVLNDNLFNDLIKQFSAARAADPENWKSLEDLDLTEWLKGIEPPKVPVDPEAPSDAGQELSEEIGTVTVPVALVPSLGGESVNKTQQRRKNANSPFGFANGLPMTPFDGWYFLQQGEKVSPAREVASRNYNSNLYVENMNMNGSTDARGLADQMAAAQRRQSAGFGG